MLLLHQGWRRMHMGVRRGWRYLLLLLLLLLAQLMLMVLLRLVLLLHLHLLRALRVHRLLHLRARRPALRLHCATIVTTPPRQHPSTPKK